MNMKIVKEYVALCKSHHWEITWDGLHEYNKKVRDWRREYIGNKVRV